MGRDDRAHAPAAAPDVAAPSHAGRLDRDGGARWHAQRGRAREAGMSRTVRASIAAGFSLRPRRRHADRGAVAGAVHARSRRRAGSYGLWLASGELLAYAGLAELGMLVTLPWLVAQADGQGDRARVRLLVSTGAAAATTQCGSPTSCWRSCSGPTLPRPAPPRRRGARAACRVRC